MKEEAPDIDNLLSKAIEEALKNGKGWSSTKEKEEYLKRICDDDYLPPLFCETNEELERSGLSEALSSF